MMAIKNNQYVSAKMLLELGANPNTGDTYRGTSAMILAAKSESPSFLKLLLDYNGNPNSIETAPAKPFDEARETVLNAAITIAGDSSLQKVKLLVEAGADLNFYRERNTQLPLAKAIILNQMDIALFLLENGADYRLKMWTSPDGCVVYILEALRSSPIKLYSNQHKHKMDIVSFLRERNLDYYREPVPEFVVNDIKELYPNDWRDYIRSY